MIDRLPLKFCIFLLLLDVMASQSMASDVEDAIHAMRDGDFAEAYCMLRPLADAGDAEAQYNVGWMYLNGYGLSINDGIALEWWKKASVQGYTDASFSLAMLYHLGEGQVKKNVDLALDYYLLAIDDDHEDALLIVKSMLLRNDKEIKARALQILQDYAHLLGDKMQVRVERANIRDGSGLNYNVMKSLVKGSVVYELHKKNDWSQIAISGEASLYWIYNPLLEEYIEQPLLEQGQVDQEGEIDEEVKVDQTNAAD